MESHLRIISKKFELEGALGVWFTHFAEKEVNSLLRFNSLVGKGEVVWEGCIAPDSQARYFSSVKTWEMKIETFPLVFIAFLPRGFWKPGEKRKWQKREGVTLWREEMAFTSCTGTYAQGCPVDF